MANSNLITETILLPSAGRLYGDNFDGHVTFRAMTTDEERIRLSGQSFYDTMSTIMNECIVDNKNNDGTYKIDSRAFTDFDFFAACVKLRILSYGAMYKTIATCPVCGHQFKCAIDLTQLIYNFLPDDFSEPYEVGPLPHSGDTLGCRFIRVKDKLDIEKKKTEILAKNPKYLGDPAYNLEMERRIMTVNGKPMDYIEAEKYVHNMIAMDNSYYHDKIDSKVYGVVRVVTTPCENPVGCHGDAICVVRADRDFFRPGCDY